MDVIEILTLVVALLGFGLACFEAGYHIGKDVESRRKSRH